MEFAASGRDVFHTLAFMSEILSFVVRLAVFSALTYVGSLVVPTENELPLTRSMRLSIAALQVAVICSSVLFIFAARLLFSVIASAEISNHSQSVKKQELDIALQDLEDDEDDDEFDTVPIKHSSTEKENSLHKNTEESHDADRAAAASVPYEAEREATDQSDDIHSKDIELDKQSHLSGLERALHETRVAIKDAEQSRFIRGPPHLVTPVEFLNMPLRQNVDNESDDVLSGIKPTLGEKYHHRLWRKRASGGAKERQPLLSSDWPTTFSSEHLLTRYILKVQLIGLALWQTFLCFDCTARDIDINFVIGVVTGWLCWTIAHSNLFRTMYVSITTSVCLVILFTEKHMLFTAIIRVENLGVWNSLRDIFNLVVLPFLTGIFWTYVIPSKTLIIDVKRSLVTFIIISLSLPLYWTVIDQALLQTLLVNLPRTSTVMFVVVEPLLKCLAIFVMVVSVQNTRMQSCVVALVMVVALGNLIGDDILDNVSNIGVHIASTCVLGILHIFYLVCGSALKWY